MKTDENVGLKYFMQETNKAHDTELWNQHCITIQRFLDEAFDKSSKNPRVLVVGPGNCNDIDLKYLLQKSEHVDLLDIDGDAVHKAVNQFPELKHKASIIERDITFLTDVDFSARFLFGLLKSKDEKEFSIRMNEILSSRDRNTFISQLPCYDIIIALPLFTQLFSPFFYLSAKTVWDSEPNVDSLLNTYSDIVGTISDELSKEVLDICWSKINKNGMFFVATDLFDFYDEPWKNHFHPFNDTDTFMELLKDILSKEGVLPGAAGVNKWLGDHRSLYEIIVMRHWMWGFSEEKIYAVSGTLVRKP